MSQALSRTLSGLLALTLIGCSNTSGDTAEQPRHEASTNQSPAMAAGDTVAEANADLPSVRQPGSQQPGSQQPDPQERQKALIRQSLDRARANLQARLFQDALKDTLITLELDPNNDEARTLLAQINRILGAEEAGSIIQRFEDNLLKETFMKERDRLRARQEMQLGRAQLDQGRYSEGVERHEQAVRILRFSPYVKPNDPLRREAEAQLELAKEEQQRARDRAEAEATQQSREELDQAERDRMEQRDIAVANLLDRANEAFQLGNYEQSVSYLDQALQLDPNNEVGQELFKVANDARHATQMDRLRQRFRTQWVQTFDELRDTLVPQTIDIEYDLAHWAKIQSREPESFEKPEGLEAPEVLAIREKLESTVIEHNFSESSLDDWKSFYSNVTDITFVTAPEVLDELDEDATTLSDFTLPRMSVAQALKVIGDRTGVRYRVQPGFVELVTGESARGPAYLAKFDVADLCTGIVDQAGPDINLSTGSDVGDIFGGGDPEPIPPVMDIDELVGVIQESIAPDAWGDTASIQPQAKFLLVRADEDIQAQVAELITGLRRHVGIQIAVESRFLEVEDSFLQDVGVDFRGLGNDAAEGVTGRGLDTSNVSFDDFGEGELLNPANPGIIGTGTEPGFFFDDGGDGDILSRTENLFDRTLGASSTDARGLTNSGGLSLQYVLLDGAELEVILRAVQKQERSEVVEAPRLLVANNTRAHLSVLRNISYIQDFNVEIAQAAAIANPVVGVVRDGVVLDVRPVVDSDMRFITMELRPTVLDLQLPIPTFTTTLGVGQPISIQLPRVTLQRVRTIVTIPDGGSLMLGGMKMVERTRTESGVPLLSDIPLLGFFFSRKGTYTLNRKVLILLEARIVLMDEYEPKLARR